MSLKSPNNLAFKYSWQGKSICNPMLIICFSTTFFPCGIPTKHLHFLTPLSPPLIDGKAYQNKNIASQQIQNTYCMQYMYYIHVPVTYFLFRTALGLANTVFSVCYITRKPSWAGCIPTGDIKILID